MRHLVLLVVPLALAACNTPPSAAPAPPASVQSEPTALETSGQCLLPRLPMATVHAHPNGGFPRQACIDLASDAVGRMPVAYKLAQMVQAERRDLGNGHDLEELGLGSVLSGGGSAPPENTALGWAKMVNEFRQHSLDSYTHIPVLYGVDAVHGHNNVGNAVLFPHNVGLGATRDPELVERVGRATAEAVAGTNIDWTFAPVLAVARDERWGRAYEAFGESPELPELLGPALIRGLQGAVLGRQPNSVLACAKHFIGDGNTQGGKDRGDAALSLDEIRAQLLPAYRKAIEAGVGSVMVSYSSIAGIKNHCNGTLINDVLKSELGFNGLVVSDWEAVELLPGDYATQLTSAINAGLDMVMRPKSSRRFINTMQTLVPAQISEARIDDAVTRILTVKCELGMFRDDKFPLDRSGQLAINDAIATVGSAGHRELAREAVRKSLVLLQNRESRLPLPKHLKRILVAGRNANDIGNQSGGWSIEWQGQSGAITRGTTIFQGIAQLSGSTNVYYAEDATGVEDADVGIVVMGERPYAEANGDDQDLALDENEVAAAERVAKAGVPLVVVLVTGRPRILDPILPIADAIVVAWLPGTEGQGVADVLFGDYDFTGKLPVSWPRAVTQEPINVGDANYDPLFPYGFGLHMAKEALPAPAPTGTSPNPASSSAPGVMPTPSEAAKGPALSTPSSAR
jgi:beta-glucosidase